MSCRSPFRRATLVPAMTGLFAALAIAPALADLHPGDKVSVQVYAHPELATTTTVDANGNVSVPVAGMVHAQGLEPRQLAGAIQARLDPFVRTPAVDVQLVAQNQTLYVSGGPGGVLAYQPGETLVSILDQLQLPSLDRPAPATNPHDVVSAQGQPTINGTQNLFDGPTDYKRVSVLRDGRVLGPYNLLALRSLGQPGIALAPNDTIQLPNKPVAVRVTGDVAHPGIAYLDRSDPLLRALDQVGGVDAFATETDIQLTRDDATSTVSLGGPVFSLPAVNGDVLEVPRAPRVDVLGTVVKPGETYLRGNQTLVSALYYAGGPDRYANLKSVQVTHDGVMHEYNLKQLQKGHGGDNPHLADGDVVFVPQGSTLDASTVFQAIASLGFLIVR